MSLFMGIDIGSMTSKGVIVRENQVVVHAVLPSGINYRLTAEKLKDYLIASPGIDPGDIKAVTATGTGGSQVGFADYQASSIVCSARGIIATFPAARTVVNIGGQSSQIISIDEKGQVIDFVVSETCAAGSARFLQVIARVLQIDLQDVGPMSLKSSNPVNFTTGCAVFGETEAISRIAQGTPSEDILAGVHKSIADKIQSMARGVKPVPDYVLCGGGALDIGLVKWVTDAMGVSLLLPPRPQLVTALGAALVAEEKWNSR
ncbi:MAG: acyl-CoA dehydratase activase [Bacillota bacterium]